jgi:hypothetical protein
MPVLEHKGSDSVPHFTVGTRTGSSRVQALAPGMSKIVFVQVQCTRYSLYRTRVPVLNMTEINGKDLNRYV